MKEAARAVTELVFAPSRRCPNRSDGRSGAKTTAAALFFRRPSQVAGTQAGALAAKVEEEVEVDKASASLRRRRAATCEPPCG